MTSITFFLFFIPILAFVLLAVNLIFAPHNPYKEKNNAFECGFTSFMGQNRTQFSISFFIFALLFLLFDLEILLVYPYLVSSYVNEVYGLFVLLVFLLALTLGFAFELGKKALTIDSRQMTSNKVKSNKLPVTNVFRNSLLLISKRANFRKNTGFLNCRRNILTTSVATAGATVVGATIIGAFVIISYPMLVNILKGISPLLINRLIPDPQICSTLVSFYGFIWDTCRELSRWHEIFQLPAPSKAPENLNELLNELRPYITNLLSIIEQNRENYINLLPEGSRPAAIQLYASHIEALNNLITAIVGGDYAEISANVYLVRVSFVDHLIQLDQLLMSLDVPGIAFPVQMLPSVREFVF